MSQIINAAADKIGNFMLKRRLFDDRMNTRFEKIQDFIKIFIINHFGNSLRKKFINATFDKSVNRRKSFFAL